MGLGKTIVMGLLGLSVAAQLIMAGAYSAGYESRRCGIGAAAMEITGAVISGLSFLALYFNW